MTEFLRFVYICFVLRFLSHFRLQYCHDAYCIDGISQLYACMLYEEKLNEFFSFFLFHFLFCRNRKYKEAASTLEIIIPLLQTIFFSHHVSHFLIQTKTEKKNEVLLLLTSFHRINPTLWTSFYTPSLLFFVTLQLMEKTFSFLNPPTTRYSFNQKRYTKEFNINSKMTHTIPFRI